MRIDRDSLWTQVAAGFIVAAVLAGGAAIFPPARAALATTVLLPVWVLLALALGFLVFVFRVSRRSGTQGVTVLLDYADITIRSREAGTVLVYAWLVNPSQMDLLVDGVDMSYWQVGGLGVQQITSRLLAPGGATKRSIGRTSFSIGMSKEDVGNIAKGVGTANNARTCPDSRVNLRGYVVGRLGKEPVRIAFEFNAHGKISLPDIVLG